MNACCSTISNGSEAIRTGPMTGHGSSMRGPASRRAETESNPRWSCSQRMAGMSTWSRPPEKCASVQRIGRQTAGRFWVAADLLPLSSAPHAERDIRVVASDPVRDLYAARAAPNQRWITFNAVDPRTSAVSTIYAADLKSGSWTAISDRGAWDDKSRWAPDGRAIYYVSNLAGVANVWGRRFDPATGRPIGAAFAVTDFATPRQTPSAQGMEIVVTRNRLVVPITEASSDIWILDTAAR